MASVLELIEGASSQMQAAGLAFGQGTINAWDEAVWLVLWKLGLPLDDLDTIGPLPVSEDQAQAVQQLIQTRITTRQPAAYLTQEAWLQGVPFFVDQRSIVPRSFIAELIADASIDPWLHAQTRRALDLCTGNGSLAVLAAMAWPELEVDAADVSPAALEVAAVNLQRHQLDQRIRLITSDGLTQVQGPYDLILCNPPYVNARSMAALPPEFLAEPALALDGNTQGQDDGMDFVRPLLSTLRSHPERYLNPQGVLVLEIGNEREHFDSAFPELEVVWLETSAGFDQVMLITREALLK
ncbi:MAG: 50S ribosomal protein L3 N(5)-glutamine methyltransferase [Betaproteobacteria bacterium]|nr:50S ribosomal protein L3 N(5)-glutamine methyltransferase [Betaproteobacteria bacterium]